jgi:hypothetical protein
MPILLSLRSWLIQCHLSPPLPLIFRDAIFSVALVLFLQWDVLSLVGLVGVFGVG